LSLEGDELLLESFSEDGETVSSVGLRRVFFGVDSSSPIDRGDRDLFSARSETKATFQGLAVGMKVLSVDTAIDCGGLIASSKAAKCGD
jgi:hypothetical protein